MITLLIDLFQQATLPDVNPKTIDSHESMEVDNSEVQQTEIAISNTYIPSSNLQNIHDGQEQCKHVC